MSALDIVAVPAFADNYLWLVHDEASGETAVVDPGDPAPVLAEARRRGWRITKILNTHWHPDHTLGHIAYIFRSDEVAFVGDTLFAMGCGRLFEGTPEQMHRSLGRLAELPEDMQLYCAHEYTLANARFAANAFPDSDPIARRLAAVEQARAADQPTVPTMVGIERNTNPFLLARDVDEFASLRTAKDNFR